MTVFREPFRALRIVWALARRNLLWGLYRDLYRAHVRSEDCACEADLRISRRAARLREALEELGPTFVKLGQVLSRRPDLVPRAYAKELEKLQDRAAPVPFRAIRAQLTARCICSEQLRHETHDPHCLHCLALDEVFESFDKTPVAAASLAQVHRARFQGKAVAVKILRPGVLDRINTDLAVLRRFRRLMLRGLGLAGSVDPREFFDEFRRRLQAELDLAVEGLNIDRFRDLRDPDGRVTAPRVFWEFRRSDILVMEFAEGRAISTASGLARARRRRLAQAVVRDYLKQILIDNFFHADPHPGNLLLAEGDTLVYLDFGAVGSLTPPVRAGMRQLFRSMLDGDADRAVRAVLALGRTAPETVDLEGLQEALERIIFVGRTRPGSRWSDEIIETARRFGIRLPRNVLALAKGLLLIESVALELDPEFSFFDELRAMAPEVGLQAVEEALTQELPRLLEQYGELLRQLPAMARALFQPSTGGTRPVQRQPG